jgi:hypothetical protein
MSGTPWIKINGLEPYQPLNKNGILIPDPAGGELYRQLYNHIDSYSAICQLVYFSSVELRLTPQCTLESIVTRAEKLGAKSIPYGIALRILQQPSPFRVPFYKRLVDGRIPFRHCILSILPVIGPDGQPRVLEAGERFLRFKRADGSIPLDQSHWAFAT